MREYVLFIFEIYISYNEDEIVRYFFFVHRRMGRLNKFMKWRIKFLIGYNIIIIKDVKKLRVSLGRYLRRAGFIRGT